MQALASIWALKLNARQIRLFSFKHLKFSCLSVKCHGHLTTHRGQAQFQLVINLKNWPHVAMWMYQSKQLCSTRAQLTGFSNAAGRRLHQTVKSMTSLKWVLRMPEIREAVTRFDASCQRLTYHPILAQHKEVAFQASQFSRLLRSAKKCFITNCATNPYFPPNYCGLLKACASTTRCLDCAQSTKK